MKMYNIEKGSWLRIYVLVAFINFNLILLLSLHSLVKWDTIKNVYSFSVCLFVFSILFFNSKIFCLSFLQFFSQFAIECAIVEFVIQYQFKNSIFMFVCSSSLMCCFAFNLFYMYSVSQFMCPLLNRSIKCCKSSALIGQFLSLELKNNKCHNNWTFFLKLIFNDLIL